MRLSLCTMGVIAALIPVQLFAAGSSSSSAPATLYDRIKNSVDQELGTEKVEPEIAEYVKAVLKKKGQNITVEDVTHAMNSETWSLCVQSSSAPLKGTFLGCDDLAVQIRILVTNERRIRSLGRDLQLTAASYELPLSDLPGRSQQMTNDLHGVVSIWRAGTGSATIANSGAIIRTQTIDDAKVSGDFGLLANALNALSTEERTAAVWRYQYGVRLVYGEKNPPYKDTISGPGTERQYLFKRWSDVEDALDTVLKAINAEPVNPPLTGKEVVRFVFSKTLMKNTLPDNIIVWGTRGFGTTAKFEDAGLQWDVPLEPVLPSLMQDSDDPIVGGTYPPAPEAMVSGVMTPIDGRGFCEDPVQARGYLCRPLIPIAGTRCPVDPANPVDATKISLVTCLDQTTTRATMSGPDVCRDVEYRDNNAFNPNTECKITLSCKANCNGLAAYTKPKDANGVIDVCISNANTGKSMTPLIYHELVHAYQWCDQPVGFIPMDSTKSLEEQTASCCEIEGGGYRAQCDMAERDGAFDGVPPFMGIPINAETCAEVLTNVACGPDGYQHTLGCYESRTYPPAILNVITAAFQANPKNLPLTCAAAIAPATMDPRIHDLLDALQNRSDVCAPGQTQVFKNTIGNNMCYIGQCIEESTETHRVTGAQSPATVGDQSFPWNDPQNGAPLGNAMLNPPVTPSQLPIYRPQLVVQQLENEICQLQGLPPLTPSILCTYNPNRNILAPVTDYIQQAQNFLQGAASEERTTDNVLSLSSALGSRMGTTLYADQLAHASRSLSDILSMAVRLFKQIGSVDFPTEMCPTDNTLPTPSSASGT